MVLPASVRKKLEQLEIYIGRLDEMSKINQSDFLENWKAQDIVVRNLQVSIEACIDIGAHIISQKGLKVPETYVQIIETLAGSILPNDFSEGFKDLVKFRNIIVHEYMSIDYKKVYRNLQRIGELREFVRFIVDYLSK